MVPFGKYIERNVIDSLLKAGAEVQTGVDLDHNRKIDFLLADGPGLIGVQVSLRMSEQKARVAKICSEGLVDRFIYLCVAPEYFIAVDIGNGRELYRLLVAVSRNHRAAMLIVNKGYSVMTLTNSYEEDMHPRACNPTTSNKWRYSSYVQ